MADQRLPRHAFGSTGVQCSVVGLGCSPFGHAYGVSGLQMPTTASKPPANVAGLHLSRCCLVLQSPNEDQAIAAVHLAVKKYGLNFFDVAPFYAGGDAERVRITYPRAEWMSPGSTWAAGRSMQCVLLSICHFWQASPRGSPDNNRLMCAAAPGAGAKGAAPRGPHCLHQGGQVCARGARGLQRGQVRISTICRTCAILLKCLEACIVNMCSPFRIRTATSELVS